MWWYALACFWTSSIAFVVGVFVGLDTKRTHLVQTPSLEHLSALTPTARN